MYVVLIDDGKRLEREEKREDVRAHPFRQMVRVQEALKRAKE
jgi:hypothetical protein